MCQRRKGRGTLQRNPSPPLVCRLKLPRRPPRRVQSQHQRVRTSVQRREQRSPKEQEDSTFTLGVALNFQITVFRIQKIFGISKLKSSEHKKTAILQTCATFFPNSNFANVAIFCPNIV